MPECKPFSDRGTSQHSFGASLLTSVCHAGHSGASGQLRQPQQGCEGQEKLPQGAGRRVPGHVQEPAASGRPVSPGLDDGMRSCTSGDLEGCY